MCTIVLTLALISVNCPQPRLSAVEAARILEQSPGLSNRTHAVALPTEPQRTRIVFVTVPAAPQPIHQSTETERAVRMGIPGGWTPLEWAILHGGAR